VDKVELSNNNEIQKTADYYSSMNAPKKRWRTSIVIGCLGILSGIFYSLIFDPINLILIFIGIILLIAGIRARMTTKLNSLLFSGVALLVMGAWNLLVVTSNIYIFFTYYRGYTMPLTLAWGIILGIYCLGWAGETFATYRKFSSLQLQKPNDQSIKDLESIITPMTKANADNDHDIIEFTRIGGWSAADYKAKLTRTSAIIVSKDKSEIYFVGPEELAISDKGRMGLTQYRKAEILFKGKKWKGRMKQLSIQRYDLWKTSLQTPS
jgi:hypothetical protein